MKNKAKSGFTLVELLVVVAIIGILVGLLLPAVQQVREAARNTTCKNNMRQIGLATMNFESSFEAFPPARLFPKFGAQAPLNKGTSQPSWFVRILPFLEQENFYQRWDLNATYKNQEYEATITPLSVYICPSRRQLSEAVTPGGVQQFEYTAPCGCGGAFFISVVGGATGDYAGNHGDLSAGVTGSPNDYFYGGNGNGLIISSQARETKFGKLEWIDKVTHGIVFDGLSNTFLAGELHVTKENVNTIPFNGPIYNGEDLAAFTRVGGPGVPIAANARFESSNVLGFGSWHPGTCNFISGDGSVKSINNQTDTITLGQLCNRNDGDVIKD